MSDVPTADELRAEAARQRQYAEELRDLNDLIELANKLPIKVGRAVLQGLSDAADAYSGNISSVVKKLAKQGLDKLS